MQTPIISIQIASEAIIEELIVKGILIRTADDLKVRE